MSDLISRKDILDMVEHIPIAAVDQDEEGLIYKESVLARVEYMSATQKWIPCTEKLPEKPVEVLVYAMNTHYSIAKYKEIRKGDQYIKTWITSSAFEGIHEINNVLAWMPLPEQYTESSPIF